MEYGNILKAAWRATWKHKAMWLLGMALLGGCNSVVWNAVGNSVPTIDPNNYETATILDGVGEIVEEYWLLVLLLGLCVILLMLVAWVFHYIALGGMYHGAKLAAQREPVRFWALCQAGTQTFWRVLGASLLFSIGIGLATLILVACLILLALTIVGLIVVIPAVFLLILGAIPLSWVMAALFSFTIQGIVIEQHTIGQSLSAAWRLFKTGWLYSLVAYGSLIGWQVVSGFALVLIFGVIGLPVAIFGVVAYTSQAWLVLGLAVLAGISLFGLIALIIKGISQSFAAHTWHGFYLACRESAGIAQR